MKTALITGANKSIGFETAKQLAKAGYYIYLGCRDKAKGEEAVNQLKAEGFNNVEPIVIDISSAPSVTEAAKTLAAKIESLDVLINNAGISGGFPQPPPSAVSIDLIKNVFETNFFGTIRTIQAFMDLLRKSDEPRIVNVSSDLASLTLHNDPAWAYYNFKGAAYGPSKTALNAYTVSLAFELKDTPFKINAVNPGFTATDFNNHRGTKNVTEAAKLIVQYAMLSADGPTGKFISDYGETPW
jgi:NAD(P)-dependent dehydrogenase (short-subunit alcohol dehydrogenase family)